MNVNIGSGPTTFVDLTLFGDGTGPAAGVGPIGSGPTTGCGPTTAGDGNAGPAFDGGPGSGPTTGCGPTIGAPGGPPLPGAVPPGAFPGAAPTPGALLAQQQLQSWDAQAKQVRNLYPGFDLGREAQNRTFRSLLRSGVPVRQAFEVLHMDELRSAAERAVTANIKAKGARPQENGAGASSGFTVKDDVSRLTPRDRAELAKRAARGEVITF